MTTTAEFKDKVVKALLEARPNFTGTDRQFAKKYGINPTVWSSLKKGTTAGQLSDNKWLEIGRLLNVSNRASSWALARTSVFTKIEQDIEMCQKHAMSFMLVDEPEIGKSETAMYLARNMRNVFYVDCSQTKTRIMFIKALAQVLGADVRGTYAEQKASVKYILTTIDHPVVILDEAGDLDGNAFLEVKEFWNATQGVCGWYLMGADGLRTKLENGVAHKRVGYRELFSRFNGKYMRITPTDRGERQQFYTDLIRSALELNTNDQALINKIISHCLRSDAAGEIGGLRRAKTALTLQRAHSHA
jgi:hypothetical protein